MSSTAVQTTAEIQAATTRSLARDIALIFLPPTILEIIEDSIPEAKRGDIAAGSIVLMRIEPHATRVDLGVLLPGSDKPKLMSVDFINNDDIRSLASAFKILDEWDQALKQREGSEV
ncbi:hypothetical protein ACFL6C_04085 [Myxococcota bacterium]